MRNRPELAGIHVMGLARRSGGVQAVIDVPRLDPPCSQRLYRGLGLVFAVDNKHLTVAFLACDAAGELSFDRNHCELKTVRRLG